MVSLTQSPSPPPLVRAPPWSTVSTATGAEDIVDSVDMISMDIYCGRWGMVQCCGDLEPQHCHTPRSQHGSDVK